MRFQHKLFSLVIVILLFAAGSALNQTLPAGPQVATFFSAVDDTEQPYGLYLPQGFNPGKKYPLVIQ